MRGFHRVTAMIRLQVSKEVSPQTHKEKVDQLVLKMDQEVSSLRDRKEPDHRYMTKERIQDEILG